MFSRSPKDAVRTAVFIGGKDAGLALDMMERFRATLLKPFEISAFADPAGSFTTAAAMVACVEKLLKKKKDKSLAKTKILIFGATGVVGYSAAVISALEGAEVTLAGHDGIERVQEKAERNQAALRRRRHRHRHELRGEKGRRAVGVEVMLCAAALACRSPRRMPQAATTSSSPPTSTRCRPAGIEGLDLQDKGEELPRRRLGIGRSPSATSKYKTESGLFKSMAASTRP